MRIPRFRIGLRTRLCHLSVTVVAALAVALGCVVDREVGATIRSSSITLLDQAQPALAESAAALLGRGDNAGLEQMLEDVVGMGPHEIVGMDPFELAACFDPDGELHAVASRSVLTAGEAAALHEYGVSNAIHSLERAWRPAQLRFLQQPLWDVQRDGRPRGTLLLATNPAAIERRIAAPRRYLWFAAAVGGAIAVLAVLLLARSLTEPLLALATGVRRLEDGIPDVRLVTGRSDELGSLARAFGQMAQAIQVSRTDLKRREVHLAQAVAERRELMGRALRELKDLGARKDAFLSSVSHEFRTPLTVMQSSAEILVLEPDDPALVAEFLPAIREQALALDRIVDNLLCLLDLERCERVAMPRASTFGAILDAALAEIEPERVRRAITIVRELDAAAPVRWDVTLTVRLLRELLLNAIRFSPRDGTVRLNARTEGARLFLTVEDEGPGIPAAHCEEVFERFRQLGNVMTDKPQGTGLGLPICRAIAVLHGGWIRAEPHAGVGARLLLELPLDASASGNCGSSNPYSRSCNEPNASQLSVG